jgi:hypothetical protein
VGLIFQHVTYTLTIPLYLIMHLFTSPITRPDLKPSASLITANPRDVAFLPIALLLTYVIPTFLVGLQAPEQVSVSTRYNIIAWWQFFPLWQSVVQFLYSTLSSAPKTPPPISPLKPSAASIP